MKRTVTTLLSKNNIVVKFGGSCLSSPNDVVKAAKKIAAETNKGRRVLVVVSAFTGVTDELLNATKTSGIKKDALDEILSMGERASARLMTGALKSLGLKAVEVDPTSNKWPIVTDSNFGEAEILLEETMKNTEKKIIPLLDKGVVPVIPGFIGVSEKGKITTLGRGGSDITAVVMGSCINAGEVVFVKDVGGILTADPKRVSDAQKIATLDAEEVYALTLAGAKVLHPKALRYKKNSTILRVVGFDDENLSGGTMIRGELESELNATLYEHDLSMITMISEEASTPDLVLKVLSSASSTNAKILGVVIESSSLILYVQNPADLVQQLHETIRTKGTAKAIHCIDSIAMIAVSGPQLEEIPGIVDIVVSPIANKGVNIYGVLTISSSVKVFVPWKDREETLYLVNDSIKKVHQLKRGD